MVYCIYKFYMFCIYYFICITYIYINIRYVFKLFCFVRHNILYMKASALKWLLLFQVSFPITARSSTLTSTGRWGSGASGSTCARCASSRTANDRTHKTTWSRATFPTSSLTRVATAVTHSMGATSTTYTCPSITSLCD